MQKEIRFYDRQLQDIHEQITDIEKSLQDEEREEQQLHQKIMVNANKSIIVSYASANEFLCSIWLTPIHNSKTFFFKVKFRR